MSDPRFQFRDIRLRQSKNISHSTCKPRLNLLKMADKEATVYIIDVSRSMKKKHQGREESDLDWAMHYVWDNIATTVATGRKTANIGVLGLGTDETHNELGEEEG